MESTGEILKRIGLSSGIPADGTDTSFATELANEPKASGPACEICLDVGYVRLDVPYGHPEFGKARPCRCQRTNEAERRQQALVRLSNIGPLGRCTFETLVEQGRSSDPAQQERFRRAVAFARDFADRVPMGQAGWLVLTGPSGCGKTHLAAAIANRALARGVPAFFAIVPDLLDHLRGTFHPDSDTRYDELFEHVRSVPLLILDDLGTQHNTPWAEEKLFQLINHRYNAHLPTVVTTDLQPGEMPDRLRTRLADAALCQVILVEGREASREEHLRELVNPSFLADLTFQTFQPEYHDLTQKQAENLRHVYGHARMFARTLNGWLILQGDVGTGKTHLAAAILNEVRRTGTSNAFFVVVPDLLDHLRGTFNPESQMTYDEVFDALREARLLVLDDLGTQVSTPWASEKLFQLLNHRYNNRLPTVITMNCSLSEIEVRLASRMADQRLSHNLMILAPDFRSLRTWEQSQKATGKKRRS